MRHPVAERPERLHEEPQDQRERANLRPDRQVAGDGRGRALVRVGCPVVERHRRDLEGDARVRNARPIDQPAAGRVPPRRSSRERLADLAMRVVPGSRRRTRGRTGRSR